MTETELYKAVSDKQHSAVLEMNAEMRKALAEIRDLRHTLVKSELENHQLREQIRMFEATLRERGER